MTVPADDRRKEYPGNGVTTVFAGPRAFAAGDISVYDVVDATGVASLVSTNDYTLSGVNSTSATSITMDTAPASGHTLLILRTVDYTQETDITNQGAFLPEVIEDGFDALAQQTQQLADVQERAVRLADPVLSGVDTTLPAPAAGESFRWNADADAFEAYTPQDNEWTIPEVTGYAQALTTAIPEGSVLTFTKSSSAADGGTLDASYMPVPRAYSPSAMQQGIAAGFSAPSLHCNDDAGSVSVVLPASTTTWPIGIPQDFVQAGAGKYLIEIGDPMTSGIYLDAYTADRTAIGTYNSVSGAQVRSTGPGAMFRIVRASATVFIANGNLEDVP